MTQEQKELFETSISMVHNSLSSIFTEQDVVKVLTDLQRSITELPEVVTEPTTGFTKEFVVESLKDMFNNYDFSQYIEVEPELNGHYSGSYELELNTSFDEAQFLRDFLCELPDYFETNKEE
jgi:hypothetical protein